MEFRLSIDIEAPPAIVWEVMSDVERWHEWTPTITSVSLLDRARLTVGSRARIRQPRLPVAVWTVTELEEGTGFAWVVRRPGMRVTARHWIEPTATGSRATLSLEFTGPMGPLLGRLTRELNQRYLDLEAEGLKRRSEETSR